MFPDSYRCIRELTDNKNKICNLAEKSHSRLSLAAQFTTAFRLDFYLLHPALEKLWHVYGLLQTVGYNQ